MKLLCVNLQIFIFTLLFYVEVIQSVPFMYNNNETPIDIAPISNIANLRRSKVQDLSKNPEYEVENYPDDSQNETMHNEASPGFFQKQLEKVYSKLQFFSKFNENDDKPEKMDKNQTVTISPENNASNNSTNIEILLRDDKHPEEPTDLRSVIVSNILTPVISLAFRIFSYVSSSSSSNSKS